MTGNETILQYLTNVPAWYLATSVNDQPHVRPFSFAAEQDGKIWLPATRTCAAWARATTAPTTPRWCFSASRSPRHGSATMRSGSRSSCSDICI